MCEMKKLYICLLILCILALVFFTLLGESLYYYGKPSVLTATVSIQFGELYIPIDALRGDNTGDYVYVLMSERGYSRTIYTVSRVAVDVIEIDRDQEIVWLNSAGELKRGDKVVINTDGVLADGKRVLFN